MKGNLKTEQWYFMDSKGYKSWSGIVSWFALHHLGLDTEILKKKFRRNPRIKTATSTDESTGTVLTTSYHKWDGFDVVCNHCKNVRITDENNIEELFDFKYLTFFKTELISRSYDDLKGIRYNRYLNTEYKILARTKEDKFLFKLIEAKETDIDYED